MTGASTYARSSLARGLNMFLSVGVVYLTLAATASSVGALFDVSPVTWFLDHRRMESGAQRLLLIWWTVGFGALTVAIVHTWGIWRRTTVRVLAWTGIVALYGLAVMLGAGLVARARYDALFADLSRNGVLLTQTAWPHHPGEPGDASADLWRWHARCFPNGPDRRAILSDFYAVAVEVDGWPRTETRTWKHTGWHRWPADSAERLHRPLARWPEFVAGVESGLAELVRRHDHVVGYDARRAVDQPLTYEEPDWVWLVDVGRVLRVAALWRASQGDDEGAWRNVETCLRLSAWMRDSNARLGAFTADGLLMSAARTCRSVLAHRPGATLPPRLRKLAAQACASRTLGLMRGVAIAVELDRRKAVEEGELTPALGGRRWTARLGTSVATLMAEAWSVYRSRIREVDRQTRAGRHGTFRQGLALADVSSAAGRLGLAARMRMRMVLAFDRLKAIRRATGRYPHALPAEFPLDPSTDRPWRYRATDGGRGFLLASPGPDGTGEDVHGERFEIVEPLPPAPDAALHAGPRPATSPTTPSPADPDVDLARRISTHRTRSRT